MNIEDLELTMRSNNGLRKAGIETVEQLIAIDWDQMYAIQQLGDKSISEICWTLIKLLNGTLIEKLDEWNQKYPQPPKNIEELREKAHKYDMIFNIVNSSSHKKSPE